jgi:hypothetical protein
MRGEYQEGSAKHVFHKKLYSGVVLIGCNFNTNKPNICVRFAPVKFI